MTTATRFRPKTQAVNRPIDLDKALPHDEQAEAALLGSILIDPRDALAEINAAVPGLASRHFYKPLYRKMYAGIEALQEAAQHVDLVTLSGWLEDQGERDLAVDLASLMGLEFTSVNAPSYAQRVYDLARQRAQIQTAYQMFQAAWSGNADEYNDLADKTARLREDFIPPKQRKLKIRSLREIMQTEYPPIRMLVEKLIQQGVVTILAGKAKAGKSFLVLGAAFAIAEACQNAFSSPGYHGLHCERSGVLYMALEDTERRIKNRAKKMREALPIPEGIDICTQAPRLDEGIIEQLEAYLDEHPDTRLIIIDTLTKILPPPGRDGVSYLQDYLNIQGLRDLAHRRDVAILPVMHCRKADGADIFDTIQTTMGTQGGAENLIVLQRRRGEDRAVLHATGNDIEDESLAMKWEKESCTWSILGDADEVAESENEERIFGALEALGGEGKLGQIAERLKGEMVTSYVKTTLYRMAASGKLTNTGGIFKKSGFETFETLKPRNCETSPEPEPERKVEYHEYAEPLIPDVSGPEVSEVSKFQSFKVSNSEFINGETLIDEDSLARVEEMIRAEVAMEWGRRDWQPVQLAPYLKAGGNASVAQLYLAKVAGLAGLAALLTAILAVRVV